MLDQDSTILQRSKLVREDDLIISHLMLNSYLVEQHASVNHVLWKQELLNLAKTAFQVNFVLDEIKFSTYQNPLEGA